MAEGSDDRPSQTCLDVFDVGADADVDVADLSVLQWVFTGSPGHSMSFSRLTCPSACPLLHGNIRATRMAVWSDFGPSANLRRSCGALTR